jgi:hypothetical protein
MTRTKSQLARLHCLCKELGIDADTRKELVHDYTGGRATSASELTLQEAQRLINMLVAQVPGTPTPAKPRAGICTEAQRKQVCSLMHQLGWYIQDAQGGKRLNFPRLAAFMAKHPATYPVTRLNALTVQQATTLINQLTALI